MDRQKTKASTAGFKANCPDFDPCPLCYGCRNYDPSYYRCLTTCKGTKNDTCNRANHTDKKLAMIIRPQEVKL